MPRAGPKIASEWPTTHPERRLLTPPDCVSGHSLVNHKSNPSVSNRPADEHRSSLALGIRLWLLDFSRDQEDAHANKPDGYPTQYFL
jgi:hypothetical protein